MSDLQLNIYMYLISFICVVLKFSVLMTEFIHTLAGRIRVLGEEMSEDTKQYLEC